MLTSIIILTYNQIEYTRKCIESIRSYTPKDSYELIVVDNASTDGTQSWLLQQADIKVILNQHNAGFPKGCNQGIQVAIGDNVLLLNNDTIVTSNWLSNLRTCLYSNPTIGAVGPVTNNASYYQRIPVNYQNEEELQVFSKNINVSNPKLWDERLKLIGFCMLVRRDVLNKVGLLDEIFTPGHNEDDDLCFRIRQAGYKVMLCRDTFIHHFGSISFKANNEVFNKSTRENAFVFQKKWGFHSTYHTYIKFEMLRLISETPHRVLEIGCGCGATLLQLRNLYPNVKLYGVEINENAGRFAKAFAEIKACDVESGVFFYPEKSFDVILLDILEHLKDPVTVLSKANQFLEEEGQLIASIPNVMHFSIIKDLLHGRWTYQEAGILDETHLRFFTLHEIQKIFEKAGFNIIDVTSNDTPFGQNDQELVETLSKIVPQQLQRQLTAYQYVIKAKKKEICNPIS